MAGIVELFKKAVESLTNYVGVIQSDHAYIHQKKAFVVPLITGSISASGTYKFHFKTPAAAAGKYIHWRPAETIGISTGITIEVFEGSTDITGGSDITPVNLNRNTPAASTMQIIKHGVTVGTDGTLIQVIGGGTGASGIANKGGGSGSEHERVFAPDTDYTITITNQSGSTATISVIEFFWYEEEEGFIS